jgi:hypothetical protein
MWDDPHGSALNKVVADLASLADRVGDPGLRSVRLGEWSGKQVLGHLVGTGELFAWRIRRMIAEERPRYPVFLQDAAVREGGFDDSDVDELVERFARASEQIARAMADPGARGRVGIREPDVEQVAGRVAVHHVEHSRGHIDELARALGVSS